MLTLRSTGWKAWTPGRAGAQEKSLEACTPCQAGVLPVRNPIKPPHADLAAQGPRLLKYRGKVFLSTLRSKAVLSALLSKSGTTGEARCSWEARYLCLGHL